MDLPVCGGIADCIARPTLLSLEIGSRHRLPPSPRRTWLRRDKEACAPMIEAAKFINGRLMFCNCAFKRSAYELETLSIPTGGHYLLNNFN